MPASISKLAILVVTSLLCIAAGELWLRGSATHSNAPPGRAAGGHFSPYVADGLLGFRLKPSWRGVHEQSDFRVDLHTNELGMRGGPARREKAPGTVRILVLGDSYPFGYGVEDEQAFPARVERLLRGDGIPAEVLNAAVPGYSTDHHWLYLMNRGFALRPDLVLVATYENDLDDLGWSTLVLGEDRLPVRTQSQRRMIDRRGRMRYLSESPMELPKLLGEPPVWLQDHSHLFNWLRFRVARVWIRAAAAGEREGRHHSAGAPPRGEIRKLSPQEIQRGLSLPEFQARYHGFLMDALEASTAARGIALRIVNIPSEPGALSADCLERGETCLEISSLFLRGRDPEAFHPNDGHWSAEGHRRTATAVATWLREAAPWVRVPPPR